MMKKAIPILLLFLGLLPQTAPAQNTIFKGKILMESGKPIEGVDIVPEDTGPNVSNAYGEFDLNFKKRKRHPDEIKFQLIKSGYQILGSQNPVTITEVLRKNPEPRIIYYMDLKANIEERRGKVAENINSHKTHIENTKKLLERSLTKMSANPEERMRIMEEIKRLDKETSFLNKYEDELIKGLAETPRYNADPAVKATLEALRLGEQATAFDLIYNNEAWMQLLPSVNFEEIRQ